MSENIEDTKEISGQEKEEEVLKNGGEGEKAQPNDLLDIVFALESEKQSIIEESRKRISGLRKDLEESLEENEKLKKKINLLEQSLKQSVMLGGVDAPKTKQEQDEILLKAKTLLFEKTKVNKQQEQQIDTLKAQVDAMKAVVQVTKDMLNLKTTECEHMEERLSKAQDWIKAEQDRCAITEKKLTISKSVYEKLKNEYELQSQIFKELKEAYDTKIGLLTTALEHAKK